MVKDDVVKLLNIFKSKKIPAIFVGDDYHAIHFGVDGHHVFTGSGMIAETKINSAGSTGIKGMEPTEAPFIVTYMEYNTIHFIHAFVPGGQALVDELTNLLDGFEPVDDLSKDDIIKECVTNPVNLVAAPRTYSTDEHTAGTATYGRFHGTAISFTKDGVSSNIKKLAGVEEK